MEHLPLYVYITFGATVFLSVWMIFKASNFSRPFLVVLLSWMAVQSALSISGFYSDPETMTSRFPLLILPPLVFILSRFVTRKGRVFLDTLSLPTLTILHIIRIPVELVLFWLFVANGVPEAMTFHGRNFDIISGITAPFVYYFGFVVGKLKPVATLVWNFISLALLLNVVSSAVLSLPSRFHQFGFERPNVALGYFPFVLLPAILVPLVLLSMLAAIRQLVRVSRKKLRESPGA